MNVPPVQLGWFVLAAVAELVLVFAWALTRVESSYAGRTFAGYGGVYVAAALAWLVVVRAGVSRVQL